MAILRIQEQLMITTEIMIQDTMMVIKNIPLPLQVSIHSMMTTFLILRTQSLVIFPMQPSPIITSMTTETWSDQSTIMLQDQEMSTENQSDQTMMVILHQDQESHSIMMREITMNQNIIRKKNIFILPMKRRELFMINCCLLLQLPHHHHHYLLLLHPKEHQMTTDMMNTITENQNMGVTLTMMTTNHMDQDCILENLSTKKTDTCLLSIMTDPYMMTTIDLSWSIH